MEWRAARNANAQGVVIPQGSVVAIVELLRPTGIPFDPYRDQVLGRESTRAVLDQLKLVRDEQTAGVVDAVARELGVRELPGWAETLVRVRTDENELLRVCERLVELCEHALDQDLDVEVLGQ